MPTNGDQRIQEKLDAYLDGQLRAEELRAFQSRLNDPGIEREIKVQVQIDSSLHRLFQPTIPLLSDIEQRLDAEVPSTGDGSVAMDKHFFGRRRWLIAALAIAGAIVWVIVAFQIPRQNRSEPLFVSRPLTQIYRDAVAQGFEPYYECREPDRFAYIFEQRQGIPVHLDPMPAGSGMLGLSYSGGLSRDTTVMLCTVDERPVMVFVDRLAADQVSPEIVAAGEGLYVHRQQRDGLVMYEVTPFDRTHAIPYLRPGKPLK